MGCCFSIKFCPKLPNSEIKQDQTARSNHSVKHEPLTDVVHHPTSAQQGRSVSSAQSMLPPAASNHAFTSDVQILMSPPSSLPSMQRQSCPVHGLQEKRMEDDAMRVIASGSVRSLTPPIAVRDPRLRICVCCGETYLDESSSLTFPSGLSLRQESVQSDVGHFRSTSF